MDRHRGGRLHRRVRRVQRDRPVQHRTRDRDRRDLVLRLLSQPRSPRSTTPPSPTPPTVPSPSAVPFRYPGPPTPFTEAAGGLAAADRRVPGDQPATVPDQSHRGLARPRQRCPPPAPAAAYPAIRPPARSRSPTLSRCSGRPSSRQPDPVGLYVEPTGSSVPPDRSAKRLSARRLPLGPLLALGLAIGGLGLADNLGPDITPAWVRRRRAAGRRGRPGTGHLAGPSPRPAAGRDAARRRGTGARGRRFGNPGAGPTPATGLPGPTVAYASPRRFPAETGPVDFRESVGNSPVRMSISPASR